MEDDDELLEPVGGYIHTHADCPHCGEPSEFEGDRSGEIVLCTACDKEFEIGTVR